MSMDAQVKQLMNRSPRPMPWFFAMLILTVLAAYLHSVFISMVAGALIGAYFGNYQGRLAVMDAWRLQMKSDHDRRLAELTQLEARYRQEPQP